MTVNVFTFNRISSTCIIFTVKVRTKERNKLSDLNEKNREQKNNLSSKPLLIVTRDGSIVLLFVHFIYLISTGVVN